MSVKYIENVNYTCISTYHDLSILLPIGSHIMLNDREYKIITYYAGEDLNYNGVYAIVARATNNDVKYSELIESMEEEW